MTIATELSPTAMKAALLTAMFEMLAEGTQTPAAGTATTSGVPQTFVAATGVPQAMDSSNTFAQPSRLDASTTASAAE